MATRSRRRTWLIVLLALAVVTTVLLVICSPVTRVNRQRARLNPRNSRIDGLKYVGLGLANYDSAFGRLPRVVSRSRLGLPLASWRLQLLHYVEAMMLHIESDDRWDDPANRWLTTWPYPAYCFSPETDSLDCLDTHVVAITGPGSAFEDGRPVSLRFLDPDTILAIEVADSGVHWAELGDLCIDEVPESIVLGLEGDGLCVLFADCSVWFLRADVPLEDLKKFFTIQGAKRHDREELLGPYAAQR